MSAAISRVCQRCSVIGSFRHSALFQAWNMVTIGRRTFFYKKSSGFDKEKAFEVLYNNPYIFSIRGLDRFLKNRDIKKVIEAQRYNEKGVMLVGPDKYAALFVVYYKGKVKVKNDIVWLSNSSSIKDLKNVEVEGIDTTDMVLFPTGLESLSNLKHLRYIKAGPYFNDWYLFHLQNYSESLEMVDLSGCANVTDAGIASLVCLKKLTGLNLTGCVNVKNPDILAFHLETHLPDLVVLGLDTLPKHSENSLEEEIQNSRFLNLGEIVAKDPREKLTTESDVEKLNDIVESVDVLDSDIVQKVATH